MIGGRNKYLINGSNATPSRVQDLFRSVQLNVNNPHFLIMQVRARACMTYDPDQLLSLVPSPSLTPVGYGRGRLGTRLTSSKLGAGG